MSRFSDILFPLLVVAVIITYLIILPIRHSMQESKEYKEIAKSLKKIEYLLEGVKK